MADAGTITPDEELIQRIFRCDGDVAARLISLTHEQRYDEHSTILHQGDDITAAHIMKLGKARAMIYSADGSLVLAQEYAEGDVFGALDDARATMQEADIIAVREVRSLIIEATNLADMALRHGSIGLALSQMLMARLRDSTMRLYERTALSAQGRVYAELKRLADDSDNVIRPVPVVTDLALRVGTTRETASRAINTLARRGIIEREDRALRVLAPQRLEELII